MPLVKGIVVLIYAFFPFSHSTNMLPNAVTTWKNTKTPKRVFMTTFDRAHRRPPPTSSTPWNRTWFPTWLLTWGLVPGPIPFSYIINLVAFTFQPSPPGALSPFWLPWPSLSPTCLWPALTISVDCESVWCMKFWSPISISIIIKASLNSSSREKSRQEKSCPTSKHLRVSCHVSSGKLEETLVPFHLAGSL